MRCPRADPPTEAHRALRHRQRVTPRPDCGKPAAGLRAPADGRRRPPAVESERPAAEDGGSCMPRPSTMTGRRQMSRPLTAGARRRRHPQRRRHAAPAAAARRRRGRAARVLRAPLRPQPLPALPRHPAASARALVEAFLDPDWAERGALVGTLAGADGPERIVALASYARLRDPAAAEVAFAVADEQQGRGIGTRLLEQLASRARRGRASRASSPRCSPRTPAMLAVFARRRLRGRRAGSRAARSRCSFPIAVDRRPPHAGRRARPRRRRRVAAAVLRAAHASP